MKNTILLSMFMFIFGSALIAQVNYDTISATYTGPTIGTDNGFKVLGNSSLCAVPLKVLLPPIAIAISVDVEYNMISVVSATMSQQRSQLWCTSPGGSNEPAVYSGVGYTYDTMNYNRTGLDIAYGIVGHPFGFGVDFELHTGSNYYNAPVGCSTAQIYVEDGSYTVTIVYLPAGSPGLVTNPSPMNNQPLVELDDNISWTWGSNTLTYDVYFGTTNPPALVASGLTKTGTTGTYDPGTLDSDTEYFWQIVAKNGNNNSPGPVWSFKTACDALIYPALQNFDGVTVPELPSCWIPVTNKPDNVYSKIVTFASTVQSHSAPNYVGFYSPGPSAVIDDSLFLVFPKVGTISDKMVQLYVKNPVNFLSGSVYEFPYTIGTMTDPFDISTFTPYESKTPAGDWEVWEVFFNDYVGPDEYIALLSEPDFGLANYLDDVTISLIPSCVKPLFVTADEVLAEQATISFTELSAAPEFQVEYGASGFAQGTGNLVIVNTNPFTLTGLTDGTYYDIYVRSICSVGDTSDWSWPITILTECLPWSVPFFEDFGASPAPAVWPLCWSHIAIYATQYGGIFIDSYESLSGFCIVMDPSQDAAAHLIAITPELSPAINTLRADFWVRGSSASDRALIIGTMTDPADENTFTPYDTISGILGTGYTNYTIYFHNYTGTDSFIAWRHNSVEYANQQIKIDNITIESIPSCVEPYKPFVNGPTASSSMLNWTDPVETATDWQIEVGAQGFTPGTATYTNTYNYNAIAAEMQSFDMTGLSAATLYDAYIRTNCGSGSYSVWEGPVLFSTGYNPFTLPYSEGFETGFGTTVNDYQNTFNWVLDNVLTHSGDSSVWADPVATNLLTATLEVTGVFDLTAKANQMLTFWHIPKVDGNAAHCYIEISIDGGLTFDQLPESTYYGAGKYYLPTTNAPEGPCFDEDSYIEYGTGNEIPNNTWWRKEYFDLSDYSAFDNVVFRFRLFEYYTNKAGWWIDDIAIGDKGTPGFTVAPLTISRDASPAMPIASTDVIFANSGDFPAHFAASIVYDETDAFYENFDAGTLPAGWSIEDHLNDGLTWAFTTNTAGYSFDGTYHVTVNSNVTGAVGVLMAESLVSPVVDLSTFSYATLEFSLAYDDDSPEADSAKVSVFDGTDWVVVHENYSVDETRLSYLYLTNPYYYKKSYDVSAYINPNFQVKFWYTNGTTSPTTGRALTCSIDNVKVRASMTNPIGWLSIDGREEASGTAMPDADGLVSMLNVQMSATQLGIGTYNAEILVTSTDAGNPSTTIPVTFNVVSHTISGHVTYNNAAMTVLNGCAVELRNASDAVLFTTTTDATGYYEFPGLIDGDYTVHTSCAKAWGGMTTFDATLILRYAGGVAGFDVLTNLQKRAADVNMTNTELGVTTFDATLILRRAGEVATPQWTAPDFVFDGPYPAVTPLSGYPATISGSNATVNYQGLCSGDVNGNYTPPTE